MKRFITIGLLIIFIYLQYRLWFEPNGVLTLLHFRHQLKIEQATNLQYKQKNDDLNKQVQQLHHNPGAIESRARQELGMIKQGEVFYQITQSTDHTGSR